MSQKSAHWVVGTIVRAATEISRFGRRPSYVMTVDSLPNRLIRIRERDVQWLALLKSGGKLSLRLKNDDSVSLMALDFQAEGVVPSSELD